MKELKETIQKILEDNLKVLEFTFSSQESVEAIARAAKCVMDSLGAGGKVLLCGNGGSASDAQHIAGEFIGRFKLERKSYPAIALTTDSSVLTCVANDYSFEDIFKRQVEGLGKEGDVLIAISTSGNSENVIRAIDKAKELGIKTISFTGGSGGKMKGLTDCNINISSDATPFIQSGHCVAYHAMCEIVEKELAKILG